MNKEIINYIPKESSSLILNYLQKTNLDVKITNIRKTKHGDFRINSDTNTLITINKTLNKFRFLITLIHEIAHYETYLRNGRFVKPHGKEWKNIFRSLMVPFLNVQIFPQPILKNLSNYIKNPKATTDSDFDLLMSLNLFESKKVDSYVFQLSEGDDFKTENGRIFKMIRKRVKRYECKEIFSGKTYLFSPHAEVVLVKKHK